jgi:hypothetical protein
MEQQHQYICARRVMESLRLAPARLPPPPPSPPPLLCSWRKLMASMTPAALRCRVAELRDALGADAVRHIVRRCPHMLQMVRRTDGRTDGLSGLLDAGRGRDLERRLISLAIGSATSQRAYER